LEEMGQE